MLKYDNLTLTDIRALPRDRTIFALAMSPIEVHGPHLPVGIDVVIAENVLALVAEGDMKPYLGAPSLASREAGDNMLEYHAAAALRLIEDALAGKPPYQRPLGRALRFARHFR